MIKFLVIVYLVSAIGVGVQIIWMLSGWYDMVNKTTRPTRVMEDKLAALTLLLIAILVPILNTLILAHCLETYWPWRKKDEQIR
jgi:UDP-N-acetylmuramyl pentapeptide phosphotransferase/UDP-N-acetylglucosamine-1-phosphate transferase